MRSATNGINTTDVHKGPNLVIGVLQKSSNPRLASINSLLESVVRSARLVVKGTDSQKRFHSEFTEFCCVALMGRDLLEDAIYDMLKEEESDVFTNGDDDFAGISALDLIKIIVNYVASHTETLGTQYLEHIGMSALARIEDGVDSGHNHLSSEQGDASCRSVRSKILRGQAAVQKTDHPMSSDGLGAAAGEVMIKTDTEKSEVKGKLQLNDRNAVPTMWLRPWKIGNPTSRGVILDHILTEDIRRMSESSAPPTKKCDVTFFDICTASSASDMLGLWGARERLVSSEMDSCCSSAPILAAAARSDVDRRGKRDFFPNGGLSACTSISSDIMTDLVFHGISSFEMLFGDVERGDNGV
uniref:Uncharacterized protein n=1 Tax=Trypanosoma congolense (strain IL3000) TaxID=1068625 RepID=G0UZ69_TRYCI|nr:conserved hypothetical protein [Trypanosoma congolense IL3000]